MAAIARITWTASSREESSLLAMVGTAYGGNITENATRKFWLATL
jgi:hypothetical protein